MNRTGDIAELAFVLEAYRRSWTAFLPYSHDTRVDVILHKPSQPPITVQVKKGVYQKKKQDHHADSWKVVIGSCKSSRLCNPQTDARINRYTDEFDVLAIYIQELNVFSLHLLSEVNGRSSMRFNASSSPRDNWEIFDGF
jgi:hypothetical protein